MKIATIAWDEVKKRMTEAGCAQLSLEIIRCLRDSGQKFYGYGARFNGENPRDPDRSDWDFAVICSEERWNSLRSAIDRLGFRVWEWVCPVRCGQPVFSNGPDKCANPGDWESESKDKVDVRRIETPDDLIRRDRQPGNWTEIV